MQKTKLIIPPSLEVATELFCPNNCAYCPQALFKSRYMGKLKLSLPDFKRALENVPTDVQITFASYTEPFTNPEAPEMMLYAHKKGHRVAVYTTMVGFKPEYADKIKDIPFTWFHVHDIGQPKVEYPFIDEWIKARPNDRAGNLNAEKQRKPNIGQCSHCGLAFNSNLMLPNGDVYICCSDWGLENKIGNIFETNFNDLDRNWDRELCYYCVYDTG